MESHLRTVVFRETEIAGAGSSNSGLTKSAERKPSRGVSTSAANVTILVAEDEKLVRDVIAEILQADGFSVLEAEHGREALDICRTTTRPVDLILTDVVMPHMGGLQLAEHAKQIIPDIAILFMSGHGDNTVLANMILRESDCFIEKPFSLGLLLGKVREMLRAKRVSADRKALETV